MIDKLVLVDSCLHSFDGHQFNYIKGLIDSAGARGISTFTLSNDATTIQVAESVSAVPAFNFLGVELISDFAENPTVNYNYNFVHFNLRFLIGMVNASHRLSPSTTEPPCSSRPRTSVISSASSAGSTCFPKRHVRVRSFCCAIATT